MPITEHTAQAATHVGVFKPTPSLLSAPASSACAVQPYADESQSIFDHSIQSHELGSEQTPDGAFRRNPVTLIAGFGDRDGQIPVIPNRYHVLGALGCGWNRRQRIALRLTGVDHVVIPEIVYGRDDDGWRIIRQPGGVVERFGTERVNDFYRRTDPTFQPDPSKPNYKWRGTTPVVVDIETGLIVSNNYHTLTNEWETAWKPFHKPGAFDLYPRPLRREIDLLNQQIFDDVNNGTYKVIFARSQDAANAAYTVFKARLADYDFRLESRRYLFGPNITDSDIRLFQTLESYEYTYRPGIAKRLPNIDVLHIWDFPNLWAYARDLFATDGFIDKGEQYELGFIPWSDDLRTWYGDLPDRYPDQYREGEYAGAFSHDDRGPFGAHSTDKGEHYEYLERWQEAARREHLTGSAEYSGPGGGGFYKLFGLKGHRDFYD